MMQNRRLHSQSVQSVWRKQVACNPKINYIHLSAIELGLFFVGFHSGVMKERPVD